MAGLKEIERRIKSVQNTVKITRAMKLVSAAKLKRAQDAVSDARFYTENLQALIAGVVVDMEAHGLSHSLMEKREETKAVKLLVVGANRGLCGAYNSNVNKAVNAFQTRHKSAGLKVESVLLGRKPKEYFKNSKFSFARCDDTLPEDPNLWPLDLLCEELIHDFVSGAVDEVHVVYTKFKSALSQTVETVKLLPIDPSSLAMSNNANVVGGMAMYEPGAGEVFAAVLPRLLSVKIRQCCLDAKASEHGSRMAAMDAATRNANELVNGLKRTFNKMRQSNITAEMLDIVGGAEAIKG
jgi:F-type H+-transporting ATPase subunit gamma